MSSSEYILQDNPGRFVLFPIKEKKIWDLYKQGVASFWTAEEIDLHTDIRDWNEKMTPDERHFFSIVLAFFSSSDGLVNENLAGRFMQEVQLPEARCFYGWQIATENIHAETYSMILTTLISNEEERKRLLNAIETVSSVKKKAEWCFRYIYSNTHSFAERLLAFAIVEGVFFSGSFCSIYYFGKRGLLPGVCFSNQLIARDEGLHTTFATLLYSMLTNKLTESEVHAIVSEAVILEKEFIDEALPVGLIGMNACLMGSYIEFVADRLLYDLGYNKLYHAVNGFDFMELLSLQGKTNFFEKRVAEYAKSGVCNKENAADSIFCTTADF